MQFKKILIAVDDSALSAHAADVGLDLAAQLGAEVALLTAVDPAGAPSSGESGISASEWSSFLKRDAKALLHAFASRRTVAPPPLLFVEEGKPAARVVEAARNWRADLIVMGSNSRNPVADALLGGVAKGVLHHAPCPLMLIRAE